MNEFTKDAFLNGRLTISQPASGYRAATDPVLMAATIPAIAGQSVLDVGCGVGVASLCLMSRISDLSVTGLELQDDYAGLAVQNGIDNGLSLQVVTEDLQSLSMGLKEQSFDHVMTNPPFFKKQTGTQPIDASKTTANMETMALGDWIDLSLRRLKPKGSFTIIHRAERLDEIMAALVGRCGDIRVLPIASRGTEDAGRVIVQGRKATRGPLRLLSPLVMHMGTEHSGDRDSFGKTATDILRNGAALSLN